MFQALPVHPGPWDRPSHRWPQASNPSKSLGKKSANHDLTATDPKAADCWASSLQVRPWHRQLVGQGGQGSMDCTCRSSYRIPKLGRAWPSGVYGCLWFCARRPSHPAIGKNRAMPKLLATRRNLGDNSSRTWPKCPASTQLSAALAEIINA